MGRGGLIVLDASALLALLLNEPGADTVLAVVRDSCMSAVNFSESLERGVARGFPAARLHDQILRSGTALKSFDAGQAVIAADFRPLTRHLGLSLGDRACLALGKTLGAPVLTADRAWATLDVGLDIRLIR